MADKDLQQFVTIQLSDTYVAPEAFEDDTSEWVEIGEEDKYFSYIDECYTYSPTNSAIINSIAAQAYGKGIEATDGATNPKGYIELVKLARPKELKRMAADLARYGSYSALYIFDRGGKGKITEIKHIPRRNVRPSRAKDGKILKYGIDWDWDQVREKKKKPQFIYDNFEEIGNRKVSAALYVVSPYSPAHFYFNPVPYQGALKYAEIERRLASFRLNLVRKGFAMTHFLSFNNGIPETKKERQQIEDSVRAKFTAEYNDDPDTIGIIFSADKEHAPEILSVPLTDAANQFNEMSVEAAKQILVAHRVTSPMLVGIKQDVGLGNNADEIKTAFQLWDNTVMLPYKDMLLECVDTALNINGFQLDTYVKTLTPIEFTDTTEVADVAEVEKETGVQMSEHVDLDAISEELIKIGQTEEEILSEYELYDVSWADDEDSEADLESHLNRELTQLSAEQNSEIDTPIFKVRYFYKHTAKSPVAVDRHRPLCDRLVNAALMYRKEDITRMSSKGGAEDKGKQYNVFLYKGGVNCQHGWERRIYRKRLKKNGQPWGGNAMNGVRKSDLYAAIRGGAKIKQSEDKKAFTAPRDTPKKGAK